MIGHTRGCRAALRLLRAGIATGLATLSAGFTSPAAAAQTDLADGQWWHTQWTMDKVWQISRGDGVTVAVLDSGIDASVPELAGAVVPGADMISGGDGTVDRDPDGHGTGTASLIAGRGGSRGYRGAAPAATIMPVTVLGDDSVETDIEGIRFAVDHGADVINMSIGIPGTCPPLLVDALRYAADHDVIVVASSGNDAEGVSAYPGNCPGVLTVGATDRRRDPWVDSHRSEDVDLAAPGVEISSIGPGGEAFGGSGTSGAAALVSGAIALLRAQFPVESADQILKRVFHTTGDIHTAGWDDATGYGIVRPFSALTERVPPEAANPVYDRLIEATGGPVLEPSGMAAARPTDDNTTERLLIIGGVILFVVLAGGVLLAAILHSHRPRPRPDQGPPGGWRPPP